MKKSTPVILLVLSCIALYSCSQETDEPVALLMGVQQDEATIPETSEVMFTGTENHEISLKDAEKMIMAYADKNPDGPWAWTFGRKAVDHILAQEGSVALRIFGGINSEGQFSLVLIGVTPDGRSMSSGAMRNFPYPCPPYCPDP